MQSITLRGFADPGDGASEPVFPLRRIRPHVRPARAAATPGFDVPRPFDLRIPLPSAWPFLDEFEWNDADAEFEPWDDDEPTLPRRASPRRIAARFVGFVMLSAALFGCGTVLARAPVTHEALDWATLGHADGVLAEVAHLRAAVRSIADR